MKLDDARLLCAKTTEEVSAALLEESSFFKCMHTEDMLTLSSYICRALLHRAHIIKICFATGNSYFRPQCWPNYKVVRTFNLIWALLIEMQYGNQKRIKSIQLKNPIMPMYEKHIENYLVANKSKAEIAQVWAQVRLSSKTLGACDN